MKFPQFIAITCGLLVAASAQAQRPKSASQVVPPNLRPPAGMCRIWLDGVPPARQPAPTDCASALRNRPPSGQVIFGDDYAHPDSDHDADDSPLKGVAPLSKDLEKSLEPKPDSTPAGTKADDRHHKGDKPDANKKRKAGRSRPDSNDVASLPRYFDPGF